MKIVASWADYAVNGIVAVAEDGAVFRLPIIDSGRAVGTEWLPFAPAVGAKRKSAIQRFDSALDAYHERSNREPKILLLSPRDIDRMEKLMREGLRFPETRKEPGWHMRYNGIELGGWLGVEDGTVVICDENFKVLGSFAWSSG